MSRIQFSVIASAFNIREKMTLSNLRGTLPTKGSMVRFSEFRGRSGPVKTNLQFWVDAATPSTVVYDATSKAVSQWSDKSNNNYHVTQSTTSSRPTYNYSLGGVKARPSLKFASTHGLIRPISSGMGTISTSTTLTVFVVGTCSSNTWNITNSMWFTSTGNTSTSQRYHFSFKNDTVNTLTLWINNVLTATGGTTSTGGTFISGFAHAGANQPSLLTLNGEEFTFTPSTNMNSAPNDMSFIIGDVRANLGPSEINEVLIYDRVLSSSERSSIYNYLFWKWSFPLIDRINGAAKTGLNGAYALVRLSSSYIGATMRIRRSTDNVELDFYADNYGDFGTGLDASGTSISTWLNGASAYITTWYDQSGKGKNATQTNTNIQPILEYLNKWINFSTSRYFSLPNGTVPFSNSAYTVVIKHGDMANQTGGLLGSGTYGTANATNAFRRHNSGYYNYWWGNDLLISSGFASGNVVTYKYDGVTRIGYVNGTQSSSSSLNNRNSTDINNTIGVTNGSEYMNGQLYNIFIFSTSLSDTDRAIVEGR